MSISTEARTPTRTRRGCPVWPNVPFAVIAVIVMAVAIAIAVTLVLTFGGHTANLASGVVWA